MEVKHIFIILILILNTLSLGKSFALNGKKTEVKHNGYISLISYIIIIIMYYYAGLFDNFLN